MRLALPWAICCGLWAQSPQIVRNGVVNAASYTPSSLVDSAIARGARMDLYGTHLGDAKAQRSVMIGGRSFPVLWGDATKITAQVPGDTPLGATKLTVVVNGTSSAPVDVKVVSAQFGIYAANGKGWGPGRIANIAGSARSANSVSNAANFGQTVALAGTGLGDAKAPEVTVGGRRAKVISTRASAAGDEILIAVPADAPEGCFVPVQVSRAGSFVSNTVTMALHKGGGACQAPEYFPLAGWANERVGMIAINRTVRREYGMEPLADEAEAWFGGLSDVDKLNAHFLMPPPGTCTTEVESWHGGPVPDSLIALLAVRASIRAIRAGDELNIDDGRNVRKVPSVQGKQNLFERALSDPFGRADRLLNFGDSTVLHVTGKGGSDVGNFGFAITGPPRFEMSGPIGAVRRGQPLRLNWTDMGAGRIPIVFSDFIDEATSTRGMCYCVGTPGSTGLTIPASVLAYFPAAIHGGRIALNVASWPLNPVKFQARGLDHALAVNLFVQAKIEK